nr:ribonuclease H-like domain-containing protein [Tanacetum cinerariifolium]
FDCLTKLPRCTCHAVEGFKKHNQLMKLMQLLMGLDDSYMSIKSSILSRDPLPDRSQTSAFASNVPNRTNFQRGRTSNNNFRPNIANNAGPRHNKSNVNRKNKSSGLVCNECGYNGNTSDRCFKIICYPVNFRKNKNGQNFKKKINSNNTIGLNTSSGCTDDQLSTLISLIKDNTLTRNNVQANMAGTYFNNSKVSHPNGTEAIISKIGNLRLHNGLTLVDVLVILEYCVTFISVHKLAKDNKTFVAFDENRCYFLNQDLNLKNVLGIGNQCGGLYYLDLEGIKSSKCSSLFQSCLSLHDWHYRLGHLADLVLEVLKPELNINNTKQTKYCEICQRAKQTREPFPLSDHTSSELGELIHLDLWDPYKVARSKGFRSFLTAVDDYSRAVLRMDRLGLVL